MLYKEQRTNLRWLLCQGKSPPSHRSMRFAKILEYNFMSILRREMGLYLVTTVGSLPLLGSTIMCDSSRAGVAIVVAIKEL